MIQPGSLLYLLSRSENLVCYKESKTIQFIVSSIYFFKQSKLPVSVWGASNGGLGCACFSEKGYEGSNVEFYSVVVNKTWMKSKFRVE